MSIFKKNYRNPSELIEVLAKSNVDAVESRGFKGAQIIDGYYSDVYISSPDLKQVRYFKKKISSDEALNYISAVTNVVRNIDGIKTTNVRVSVEDKKIKTRFMYYADNVRLVASIQGVYHAV